MTSLLRRALALALTALAAAVPAAGADTVLTTGVSSDTAKFRRCHDRLAPGAPGVVTRGATLSASGLIRTELNAAGGDWDVAVFDRDTGRLLAAAAGPDGTELAEGW